MQTERLNIAANVKRLRVAREWSVAILAHRAGLSFRTVKSIEHPAPASGEPETKTLHDLAVALGTTIIALRRDPPQSAIRNPQSAILNPALLRIRASKTGFIAGLIRLFTND